MAETDYDAADERSEAGQRRWSELRAGERVRAALRTRTAMLVALAVVLLLLLWAAVAQDVSARRLVSLAVWGVMLGGVIGLGGIGLTLIYGVLKFPNFSHGALVTLGAYIAYTVVLAWPGQSPALGPFSFGWDLIVGMIVAMPLVGAVALGLDRVVYRRLRRQHSPLVLFAMASLAMAFFVRSIIYLVWGSDFHFYYQGRPNPAIDFPFGVRVQADALFILGLAFALVAAVYLLLARTKMGKAMRATANNPELAQIRGINTERVIAWSWIMSGALAAAGGVMYGLASQLRPEMGFWLLLPMFAAVIMGSIGNPRGALVGAIIIGVAQQVSTAFLSPAYGPAVAFVLMVITLLIRPQGLFGGSGD